MIIRGLQKTTLLDYPGCVAATVFLGGCNFRCPFCHNMNLVLGEDAAEYRSEEVFDFLKKRKGILDGVCVTGGEPTLYSDINPFIKQIKEMGYKVKLDTNGTKPEVIEELLYNNLLDYIAMDIKGSADKYKDCCGVNDCDMSKIKESIGIIMDSGIDYEFRTTLVKELHDEQTFTKGCELIKGAKKYYLQPFVDSDYVPNHEFTAPEIDTLKKYREIAAGYIDEVILRGV